MAFGLLNRKTMDVNVIRDRAPLFVTLDDGKVRNAYTIKILNMAGTKRTVEVGIEGITNGVLTSDDSKVINNKLIAVSYTHLDVYKRQWHGRGARPWRKCARRINNTWFR